MVDNAKEQRIRLAAGMLNQYEKLANGEVRTTLCPLERVQPLVRLMSEAERAELTAEVDWLVDYEAGEALA